MNKPNLKKMIPKTTIKHAVAQVGKQIATDYKERVPYMVCVLKGAFVFYADLLRAMPVAVECGFIQASSYESGTKSKEQVITTNLIKDPLYGKDVILVEDIVDTGLTVKNLVGELEKFFPRSIRVAALLDKPSRRIVPVTIDYTCFTIPNVFVIGYGLDYDQYGRNLPDIYRME